MLPVPGRSRGVKTVACLRLTGTINHGLEMESEVADGQNSVILQQVTNGLAVRMAVLFLVNQAAAETPA